MTVNKRSKTQDDSGSNSPNQNAFNASIFIHVAFAVVTLSELLFLERCIFRLRAERYMHLHPGAALPRSMHLVSSSNNSRLAFAPWNRPPLPTYAAALAETGVGTGDVEDNVIAVPPPPPYGNTRGSMLLLSGYMRNSLRAQVREGHRGSQMTETSDRPVSYMSHDSEWEVVLDADRAMRLEQTLSRLDLGQGRNEPPANAHDHATG
ncbi:hypothetical protein NEOLEDRAFT_1129788 [Neolentinus lepideus HHB14362 ss-1]|uniref:Uncharacterized protein n=1 Tax=Neolentinus lepideus HHB14362 ss-1 TaxID=1314782 RepID=A0A165UMB5_9AGAM|nr:hypothetical protein NEOLEDRAFT_1129788 [Neolentinus lepideus HHB14362 ss-1]